MQIKVKRVIEKEEKGGTEEWRNKKKKKKPLEKNKTTKNFFQTLFGSNFRRRCQPKTKCK